MWDSVRGWDKKGASLCVSVSCHKCPLYNICNESSTITAAIDIIEAVEQWGKEHPIKTNADKFKEVFAIDPYGRDYQGDVIEWLEQEYQPPKEAQNEKKI